MILDKDKSLTLRVGSYNIASGDKRGSHNMELIAKDILSKALDIVGLQEVDRGCWRTDYADMPRLLSQYTGYAYYYYVKCVSLCGVTDGSGEYGDCILSKYPIIQQTHTMLEHGKREPRSLARVQVDVDGSVVNFCNTHLEHGRKEENQAMRLAQLGQIAELLRDVPRCILTGDFNTTPDVQRGALPFLNCVCKTKGDPITHPSSGNTIDNIFYSQDLQFLSMGTLETTNSDHCMLFAQLKIKE